MKPNSIVQFERLYLAAFALRIVNDAVGVGNAMGAGKVGAVTATYGVGAVIGALLVIYAAVLALWYFAARKQSVVAKWLISVWFVVATCTMALGLYRGGFGLDLGSVLAWAGFLLFGWSVSYLFKPDADAWFAKTPPSAN